MINPRTTILIIDDHPLVRQGLKVLIESEIVNSTVIEASGVCEGKSRIKENTISVIIMDITLPDGDGLTFAGEVLSVKSSPRIFIMTMHLSSGLLEHAKSIGCSGYFLKEGNGKALINAILENDDFFRVSVQLEECLKANNHDSQIESYANLTRREKEILRLFATGLGYKEVAWKLGISHRTASVHRYNVYKKLNISNEVEMVHFAQRIGLLI